MWCGGVAPLAGAWIEIVGWYAVDRNRRSPPSRGRGLKCKISALYHGICTVAPLAGAWIEIRSRPAPAPSTHRRPPRGGVD